MAKKYQRRTHVSVRKKKEEEQKLAKRREFYKAHKKQLIIAAIAAVVAIAVIWLAVDYFYAPGGSMRIFMGKLQGVQENSIIRNLGTTRSPRYYTFGSFDPPAGYTNDPEYLPSSDKMEQNFYYVADDENAIIQSVYAAGVKNRTGEDMLNTMATSGMYVSMSEPKVLETNGLKLHYIYAVSDPSGENNGVFAGNLVMYADTVQDSCILINVSSIRGSEEEIPNEETMIEELKPILAGLKVAK